MNRCAVLAAGLVAALVVATPAGAQKPPPLGAPDVPSGKPPPLGAPEAGRPPLREPPPTAGERPAASGSGFLVADGRVLTNAHVVAGCRRMTARNIRGERVPARIDAQDEQRDLALLTVSPGFGPALAFRNTPPVLRGEMVVTYGFPLSGLLSSGPTLTSGDISALSGLRDNPIHFQISAPVQPGNSGGPLLDAQGHVVGVVVSKLNAARIAKMTGGDIPQNVNFAIKGTEAQAFLQGHGVQPILEASTGPDRRAAEVGEIAHPATVFLQCFR
ncbi:Trypsin-like peptidase domain-containing protein [Rhodovastum atsumiense]|uniref:Trypsin-like peptidase domain-containing protein n=1 Tax=Rhodovastum atsumiense TaxID=504468 RepID=A0A5M6IRB0_9PROT|nr:serine protease [Rhodovastum atsumiense]KAA5610477.1 trypsin-like peptidase domain-containing protein [Rhodovastum atsumiense]CAH2600462.1 Trypsin-like peptidase domain-containing protein [Rhodovastum atsumiense]